MMIAFKQVVYLYDSMNMTFDFAIDKGEFVTILGPSGAGKSTLLNLIAGFIEPNSGKIILNNNDETHTAPNKRPVSMLFQDNNLFTHLTVKENLGLGLSPSLKLTLPQKQQLVTIAERLGISLHLSSYPQQLSGGQKQRVAIGRCLLQHRPILLLDEPFSSLDPKLKKETFALVYEIQQEYGLTILMVTHQTEDISKNDSRCFAIINGTVQFDGEYGQLKKDTKIAEYLGFSR